MTFIRLLVSHDKYYDNTVLNLEEALKILDSINLSLRINKYR